MSPFRRSQGILAAALILFGNVKGIGGVECAVHQAATPASAATTARAPVADEHASHQGHGDAAPESQPSSHHDSCTCLEHCQSCPTAAFAGVAPSLPAPAVVAAAVRSFGAPDEPALPRLPHQLPFATAPPVVA